MTNQNKSWTDKAKAVVILCIIPLAVYAVWILKNNQVSAEDIAKLEAAKAKLEKTIEEQLTGKKEMVATIADLEKEKAAHDEKSKILEKEILKRKRIAELIQSQSEEDRKILINQFDLIIEAKETEYNLRVNAEKQIAEYKKYILIIETKISGLAEQLQAQIQETTECQEKRQPGKFGIYIGVGYGISDHAGIIEGGWCVNASAGWKVL